MTKKSQKSQTTETIVVKSLDGEGIEATDEGTTTSDGFNPTDPNAALKEAIFSIESAHKDLQDYFALDTAETKKLRKLAGHTCKTLAKLVQAAKTNAAMLKAALEQ